MDDEIKHQYIHLLKHQGMTMTTLKKGHLTSYLPKLTPFYLRVNTINDLKKKRIVSNFTALLYKSTQHTYTHVRTQSQKSLWCGA